jgi:uncharacterized protein
VTPRSADLVRPVARFARRLRACGIDVGVTDEIDATRALVLIDLLDRDEVRLAMRTAFRIRRRHWDVFDAVFSAFWTIAPEVPPPRVAAARAVPIRRGATSSRSARSVTPEPGRLDGPDDGPDGGADDRRPGYSPQLLLRQKPFEACSPSELSALERVLARLVTRLSVRKGRRLVPTRGRGVVDPRRSFRASLATGGELLWLARRTRAVDEPRIVLLCDTSGSMDPHARVLLAFAMALKRVARRTEVFAFNTSLVRLTPWLAPGKIGPTLDRLAAGVPDWSGGTKIGESLADFIARHATPCLSHRTTVVIFSDGLDRGDVALVAGAMAEIRRRARKVIWLNPLLGDARYEPTARAMQAALPFVDRLASAHNVESLERVLPELTA